MPAQFNENAAAIGQLTAKVSMELVYAEAGKDIGLLPVNYLLTQIEELCAATPPPPLILEALNLGRRWVERVFETSGLFSEISLKQLGEWANWFESACDAIVRGQEPSDMPAAWAAELGADGAGESAADVCMAAPAPVSMSAPEVAMEEEAPLVVNLGDDAELLREFISESVEHLQNIEQGVLVLEDNPGDAETLNSIFRAFHTFKGGSGLLNLIPVNKLAHELESLLDLARQHKLEINSTVINVILEGRDVLKRFTMEIDARVTSGKSAEPIRIPTVQLIQKVKAVIKGNSGQPGGPKSVPELQEAAASLSFDAPGEAHSASRAEVDTQAAAVALAALAKAGSGTAMVKVATQKLDALVDLVGEMVIAHSQVMQDTTLQTLAGSRLARNLTQLNRITDDLQKIAMSLRMVPIRSTFQKMHRLVRDLSAKQGKSIELILHGEDTELDRTIVEELNDPLVHMIRNAVDHGIEKPEKRLEKGKPAQGAIHLTACHQGGNIVIEIRDDGGGLSRERILAKAVQQGMIHSGVDLTDSEIFALIFAPGFSTAEVVTDVSGRGVGMDVVRRNIEKLRGKIEIQSRPGQGSTFSIYLPLTLAIIDGLLIGVGEHRYIVPTLLVRESFRPTREMISTLHERGEMVSVRGRLSPLLRLHDYFGVPARSTDPLQSIILVVGTERENRCLLVDDLLGKQEVVIKSLGETFKNNQALAGAAILGDGRVGLILNVDYLVRLNGEAVKKAA